LAGTIMPRIPQACEFHILNLFMRYNNKGLRRQRRHKTVDNTAENKQSVEIQH